MHISCVIHFSVSLSQMIYDYKDCGASFGLISLHPDKLPESEKETFRKIGIELPSMAYVLLHVAIVNKLCTFGSNLAPYVYTVGFYFHYFVTKRPQNEKLTHENLDSRLL